MDEDAISAGPLSTDEVYAMLNGPDETSKLTNREASSHIKTGGSGGTNNDMHVVTDADVIAVLSKKSPFTLISVKKEPFKAMRRKQRDAFFRSVPAGVNALFVGMMGQ